MITIPYVTFVAPTTNTAHTKFRLRILDMFLSFIKCSIFTMGCGGQKRLAGALFVVLLSTLSCVVSQQSWFWAVFCFINCSFSPPPPGCTPHTPQVCPNNLCTNCSQTSCPTQSRALRGTTKLRCWRKRWEQSNNWKKHSKFSETLHSAAALWIWQEQMIRCVCHKMTPFASPRILSCRRIRLLRKCPHRHWTVRSGASLRSEKDRQNIDNYWGFIEQFRLGP